MTARTSQPGIPVSYRSQNASSARVLTAVMVVAVLVASLAGLAGVTSLVGVLVAGACLRAFNDGLNSNPRNRV